MEYILIEDNDGHWYVIPAKRQQEFNSWLSSQDYEDGVGPAWADEVGGSPSLVKFKNYSIE